ncbi:MAG: rRNA pseudouridine synthase [Planctomycetes bacterium]|nr:rRNA pseudouridine synthase [Planctomycetota bacterium]
MRLDRYLHESGAGSRREVNLLIRARRVTVAGVAARDGAAHVPDGADVAIDGGAVRPTGELMIAFHKPAGYVTAVHDELPVIFDILPFRPDQALPVGRLDKESEGLLILTSDGQAIYRLTNPKWHVEKEYEVELRDPIDDAALERLRGKIDIGRGEITRPPVRVERLDAQKVKLIIDEGKYHQIRRMLAAVNNHVTRLVRTRVGPVKLGELESGAWRHFTKDEVDALRVEIGTRKTPTKN